MAISKWKKLGEKELYKNPWWVYRQDTFELPSGEVGEYYYVHTNGSSMIVPVFDDGRILMVKQYRYLCDEESLEFPAGGVKAGSDYIRTAASELAEEAGLKAGDFQLVGKFNPYNGVTNEICRVYVARSLARTKSEPDATEQFEETLLTPAEIDVRIRSGEIWDGMTITAWTLARPALLKP